MPESTNLLPLSRAECLRLMADVDIGRVVFVNGAMPAIQPVNYLLVDNEVIYRTANGAKLATATRRSIVAFEIDDIDTQTRTGWSVVGIGPCYEVTDQDRLALLADRMPDPWVTDHTGHTIAIELERLTGRRITLAEGISPDFYTA